MSKSSLAHSYETLLGSLEEFSRIDNIFSSWRDDLISLGKVVYEKEPEITMFAKISVELCEYFENYDFQLGFEFDRIHGNLISLSALRRKLVALGEEVKPLLSYPDRYGSAKSIESCKGLVLACREKLSFSDLDNVSKVIDSNIEKLLAIRKQFEKDDYILEKIKETIIKEKKVLSKFKTAFAEIQQYVDGFPHQGQDNLAEVVKYTQAVIQIDTLIGTVAKQVSLIEPLSDRHNKSFVVAEYTNVVKEAYETLNYNSSGKFVRVFDSILKKVKDVLVAFEHEKVELIQIRSKLANCTPDIWREDNENLLSSIAILIDGDTAKMQMDIESIKKKINNAKDKRKKNVQDMTNENPWLNGEKYKDLHNRLTSRYITYTEYKDTIDAIRKERNKKLLKGVGIGAAVVAVIGIICAFWKVILGIIVVIVVGSILILFSKTDD